jgi:hypothetical protein
MLAARMVGTASVLGLAVVLTVAILAVTRRIVG